MVVLRPHPRAVGEQIEQLARDIVRRGHRGRGRRSRRDVEVGGRGARPVVERRVLVQRRRRHLGQHLAVPSVEDAQRARPVVAAIGCRDGADMGRPHLPALADRQHLLEVLGLDDREHALLALARHHLERLHARLASRDDLHVEVHAGAATRCRLARRAREAGTAQVLDADDEAGIEQRQAGLDQPLLLEGVTDLHARPLVLVGLGVETGRREHADPADAVATGRGTEKDGQVADARGLAEHEPVGGQHAEAQHVHQRVVGIGLVEHRLAAHRGHADRVAVARDAAHHTFGDPPAAWVVERTESQRVHQRDRPRTHREDVTQDAADPRGRTLVRLDRRRVVVALDPDGGGHSVTDVDHTCVLARADEHVRAFRGQPLQVDARRLVGAVLGPHHGVHGQLEMVGCTPQDSLDLLVLVVGQTQCPMHRVGHARSSCGDTVEPTCCSWAPGAGELGRRRLKGRRSSACLSLNGRREEFLKDGHDRRAQSRARSRA